MSVSLKKYMFVFLVIGLVFFAIAFVYSLQEGLVAPSTNEYIRFPNYNWPSGSSLLVQNGVIQSGYFIKYIQSTIKNRFGNVDTVSLNQLETALISQLNPTIISIVNDQYTSLKTFLENNKKSFPPFTS